MSVRHDAPAAIEATASLNARPRSRPGKNPEHATASARPAVNPTRSASSRGSTTPGCAHDPDPPVCTVNPRDHPTAMARRSFARVARRVALRRAVRAAVFDLTVPALLFTLKVLLFLVLVRVSATRILPGQGHLFLRLTCRHKSCPASRDEFSRLNTGRWTFPLGERVTAVPIAALWGEPSQHQTSHDHH